MNIESAYTAIYDFLMTNKIVALGIVALIAFLLWKKTAAFLKLAVALLLISLAFYAMTEFSGSMQTGVTDKKQIIHETGSKISN